MESGAVQWPSSTCQKIGHARLITSHLVHTHLRSGTRCFNTCNCSKSRSEKARDKSVAARHTHCEKLWIGAVALSKDAWLTLVQQASAHHQRKVYAARRLAQDIGHDVLHSPQR
eukprot:3095715-Amphidinium_carterae.1